MKGCDRYDEVTGRVMLEDSAYSTQGVFELWAKYQHDLDEPGIFCHSLIMEGQDPTFAHTIEPEDAPRGEFIKLGEFEGNGLDARRWMNRMLGYGPYKPSKDEFEKESI